MKRMAFCALAVLCMAAAGAQRKVRTLWERPTAEYRMKTWWFFGYEHTDDRGITADVEALRDAGFGGVVYYDQNHRGGNPPAHLGVPDDGFSPEWWRHLRLAAAEARRAGLSFELNVSNGYVAGGRWIDPRHAMQRVASATAVVTGGGRVSVALPEIKGRDGYVQDIAVLALPRHAAGDTRMRHFTAQYAASGKGRNGCMQKPGPRGVFGGYGWVDLPQVGTLQASDDSVTWRDILTIEPMYRSQGGYFRRTNAFPATAARYWRVNYTGTARLREWAVGEEAMLDRWEERAALHSDFAEDSRTPEYCADEVIDPKSVVDLTPCVADGRLQWDAPQGEWTILRLAAVLTGAKSKHGRENLLGYECDKLSREAAELHWDSYVQVILDSLGRDAGVVGVTMDSHEAGAQNWTPLMLEEFRKRKGYDLTPYLPMLAGYVMESKWRTETVLRDFRQTVADCIAENYYGTLQRRATENGLTFTAQAIGNALCIDGDAIAVKRMVDKPQGEFWAYQTEGAYDIKDCSSACHIYGKPVASAEAMTDVMYKHSPFDLLRVSNVAFSFGAQEFVVCATPHIPLSAEEGRGRKYFAGREYAVNRTNPQWEAMKPVWEQAARSAVMLRQGRAAPDALVYLGDDIPMKTLTSRLPDGLDGLDWDVCTGEALACMTAQGGVCYNPTTADSVTYGTLIIADKAYISPASQARIESFREAGVRVCTDGHGVKRQMTVVKGDATDIVHTHRTVEWEGVRRDIFYIGSVSPEPTTMELRFERTGAGKALLWNNRTGKRKTVRFSPENTVTLTLEAGESVFLTF